MDQSDLLLNRPACFKDLCMDAADPDALADWWCRAIGYARERAAPPGAPVLITDPRGRGPAIWINAVPEPKIGKNRMHMDVTGDVQALIAAGAALVRPEGDDIGWTVLADPEGNEFCCFRP